MLLLGKGVAGARGPRHASVGAPQANGCSVGIAGGEAGPSCPNRVTHMSGGQDGMHVGPPPPPRGMYNAAAEVAGGACAPVHRPNPQTSRGPLLGGASHAAQGCVFVVGIRGGGGLNVFLQEWAGGKSVHF